MELQDIILYDVQLQVSDDEPNTIDLLEELNGFVDYELLVNFYQNPYDLKRFTENEVLRLINELNKLECKSLDGVLILAVKTYPKIYEKLIDDLKRHYDDMSLSNYVFFDICKYGTFFMIDLDNYRDKINEGLMDAFESGNLDVINFLIDNGADINYDKNRALKSAAKYGHLNLIEKFFDDSLDEDTKNTILISASLRGHLNIINYLIKKGVDIHANDEEALRKASKNGHLKVVKFLVEKGANIHAKNDEALINAITHEHLNVVEFLVKQGADIREDDFPLRMACRYGNLEMVKFLVKNGADPREDDAIIIANDREKFDIVEFLLENGANINAGYGELLSSALHRKDFEFAKYLIDRGANMYHEADNMYNEDDVQFLTYHAERGNLDVVKFLVEQGADIHADNDSAVAIAAKMGHSEIVDFLIKMGADINRAIPSDDEDEQEQYDEEENEEYEEEENEQYDEEENEQYDEEENEEENEQY